MATVDVNLTLVSESMDNVNELPAIYQDVSKAEFYPSVSLDNLNSIPFVDLSDTSYWAGVTTIGAGAGSISADNLGWDFSTSGSGDRAYIQTAINANGSEALIVGQEYCLVVEFSGVTGSVDNAITTQISGSSSPIVEGTIGNISNGEYALFFTPTVAANTTFRIGFYSATIAVGNSMNVKFSIFKFTKSQFDAGEPVPPIGNVLSIRDRDQTTTRDGNYRVTRTDVAGTAVSLTNKIWTWTGDSYSDGKDGSNNSLKEYPYYFNLLSGNAACIGRGSAGEGNVSGSDPLQPHLAGILAETNWTWGEGISTTFHFMQQSINDVTGLQTAAQMIATAESMMDDIIAAGITPVLNTIAPTSRGGSVEAERVLFNSLIVAVAAEKGAILIDWDSLLKDPSSPSDMNPLLLLDANTHPNEQGHLILAKALFDAVNPAESMTTSPIVEPTTFGVISNVTS